MVNLHPLPALLADFLYDKLHLVKQGRLTSPDMFLLSCIGHMHVIPFVGKRVKIVSRESGVGSPQESKNLHWDLLAVGFFRAWALLIVHTVSGIVWKMRQLQVETKLWQQGWSHVTWGQFSHTPQAFHKKILDKCLSQITQHAQLLKPLSSSPASALTKPLMSSPGSDQTLLCVFRPT